MPAALRSQSLPAQVAQERDRLLNAQWDPAKLYAMLTSQDPAEREELFRAAFAAGPAIIPKLQNAIKDDRTATFAAQTLAWMGGAKSMAILEQLLNDPRNLDLRRYYYGALGESGDSRDVEILLNKIRTSDHEPDRDVTRNAILALSISSDAALIPQLEQAEKQVTDPVIQDDIETAATVIGLRAKYVETPEGKRSGSSVEQAIRGYFMPALQPATSGGDKDPQDAGVEVKVRSLTLSPDKTRVLAAVDFENPEAVASYHVVVQKRQTGWKVASVWLGEEREKPQKQAPQK
ncbi:MAG: HEAT repeat domain-containing protein [Limisphaerales bacterium]